MKKKWFSSYDHNVPNKIDIQSGTIHQLLFHTAKQIPNKIAIIENTQQLTYQELADQVEYFAKGLRSLGIKPGSRVAVILPNQIHFFISFFGCLAIGCIVVAINPAYTCSEFERILHDSSVGLVICQKNLELTIKKLKYAIKNNLMLFISDQDDRNGKHPNYFSIIELGQADLSVLPEVSPRSPAIHQYTGGTTGIPKAAVAQHKNIVANVNQFRSWLPTLKFGEENFLAVLPLFHVYGMVLSMCLGIFLGASILIPPINSKAKQILTFMIDHEVTFAPLAPSTIHALADVMKDQNIRIPSLRICISGSAPLMDSDKLSFEKHIGGKILEGYGLSEAPTATHCNPFLKQKAGSIGLPLPNVNCRIKKDFKSKCSINEEEIGELLIKGPQVMTHYHRNLFGTMKALMGGWLHTGDYAHMDSEGYFFIEGRKKEMIKVSGFQVWPREIEHVIQMIPEVKEVAVSGVKDSKTGEAVIAWVVVKEQQKLSVEKITNQCKKFLVQYKVPTIVIFLKHLPRNAVGKILKRILIQEYKPEIKKKEGF